MTTYNRAAIEHPQPEFISLRQAVYGLATDTAFHEEALFEKIYGERIDDVDKKRSANVCEDLYKLGYRGQLKILGCETPPFTATLDQLFIQNRKRASGNLPTTPPTSIPKSVWRMAAPNGIYWEESILVLNNDNEDLIIWTNLNISVASLNEAFLTQGNAGSIVTKRGQPKQTTIDGWKRDYEAVLVHMKASNNVLRRAAQSASYGTSRSPEAFATGYRRYLKWSQQNGEK
ncbi:MAG: hypothetical protein HOC57_01875 [Rhodospirillaceae bacterium]|jgi:hypothetical protein|nr:hypothetical protein [Rhodospirillaceae bacterium]